MADIHTSMHQDHLSWRSENDLWREEVAIWQEQLESASREVAELEQALKAQSDALANHAAVVRLYEQQVLEHEHILAECERGAADDRVLALNLGHQVAETDHLAQREHHERIKTHQHALLARWNALKKAMEAAI